MDFFSDDPCDCYDVRTLQQWAFLMRESNRILTKMNRNLSEMDEVNKTIITAQGKLLKTYQQVALLELGTGQTHLN